LASFYNFSINIALAALTDPCNMPVIKKIFKRPQAIQWDIVDKETVAEINFRTTNVRNRFILELMARGGIKIDELLNLTPGEIQERNLTTQNPKIGCPEETVYVPRKILARLTWYVKPYDFSPDADFSHCIRRYLINGEKISITGQYWLVQKCGRLALCRRKDKKTCVLHFYGDYFPFWLADFICNVFSGPSI
jgi:integrase